MESPESKCFEVFFAVPLLKNIPSWRFIGSSQLVCAARCAQPGSGSSNNNKQQKQ